MPSSSTMSIRPGWFFAVLVVPLFFAYAVSGSAWAGTLPSERQTGAYLDEIGMGAGYARGSLKGATEHINTYPVFVRFGFNVNSLLGIQSRNQAVQLTCEPLFSAVSGPRDGVEAGCGFGIRYLYYLSRSVGAFLEISAAPIYYSIDTVEQGRDGFNFLDQIGGGLRYRCASDIAVFGGYRWRHISHAGLAHRRNSGINSNAAIAGISWIY